MKVSTIADLNQMDDSDEPRAVKAKLKSIGKVRSGESNGREWKFQDFELIDPTGSIKGSASNRDDLDPDWVGEFIYLEAVKGTKGYSGLYIKDETFTPKGSDEEVTTRKLKVTPTATITLADASNSKSEESEEPEDDVNYGEEEKPKANKQPTPQQNTTRQPQQSQGKADACRAKEVYYERTSNLGNYESMKVGILLELEPGAKFQDCLDVAKTMVEKNLQPEGITAARKGADV